MIDIPIRYVWKTKLYRYGNFIASESLNPFIQDVFGHEMNLKVLYSMRYTKAGVKSNQGKRNHGDHLYAFLHLWIAELNPYFLTLLGLSDVIF